jgi:GntR family transcriptional regulator/MocR family aminotransferase
MRSVVARTEDIIVSSGAQQAFDLIARALVVPNQTVVAIENPGYPPMRVAFAAAGARLVPVGVDREGLIVEQLPPGTGVICVTPSHQFPLGVTMSASRRRALLEFAREHNAVIMEDDYDGEFRTQSDPQQALRTIDSADTVFYVGSFSKCMLPSLRLGYIVAPPWARETLVAIKNSLDWHSSSLVQTMVARFINEGHLAHHVRKMRTLYRQRRQIMMKQLQEELGAWLEAIPSDYGMHIATFARTDIDLDSVEAALLQKNIKLHSLSRYFLGAPTQQGFIFGYGTVDSREISQGIASLRDAMRK